ncbi:MAG: hypothetical protein WKG06_41310 [Segetibacter sp.]
MRFGTTTVLILLIANNFKVSNSYFNSSDDGICLKSLDPDAFNQNIWIQNNSMTTEASGIKFGTASLGGFKNIHILNNKVFDTYRSAHSPGSGGRRRY